jgi:riboflavin kinase/FMN adenylyltransferase
MEVFNSLSEVKKDKNTVITLGTFDGIHLGHRKIIDGVIRRAENLNARSFLITFDPHPRSVVSKGHAIKLLNTLPEKIDILNGLGVQNLLIINFTKEFSQLSSGEFFKNYIINKIGLKEIVIGYDHHFGKGRDGDEHTLREMGREYDFNVTKVDAVDINGTSVSSTKIRKSLAEGNIQLANSFLGRYYSFQGNVVKGDGRGRSLGFPTANIELKDENKLLPAIGIYAVELVLENEKHFGLMSIGKRPTFYNDGHLTTEIFIFDFDKDIYDKEVTVKVLERIRGEEKYSSPEALVAQMKKDKEAGMEIMSRLAN